MKANFVRFFFALAGILLFCGQALAGPLDNWTWRNPRPNGNPVVGTNVLDSVVFTNGNFYAVGFLGTVASSSDGRFWTEYPSATTNQLTQIIYAGGQFVAVGYNGTAETSPDGTNWTLQTTGIPNNLTSVAYGNGIYLACGGGQVVTSTDAVNWTFTPITKFRNLNAVAGSSFGFVGINGSTNVYFSTDGMNWTTNGLTASGSVFNNESLVPQIVTYADGLFLVGAYRHATSESANAYIFSSPDGTHWTANLVGNFFTGFSEFFYNFFMTGSNDVIAAGEIGPSGPATSFLQFSTNGLNWTQVNGLPGTFPQGYGGAYGNATYAILGYSSLYVSSDSLNWTNYPYVSSLPAGPTSTFDSIAYSNGTYVVATSGPIVVSTNDSVYNVVSNTPSLSSVASSGLGFVGVGSGGQIYQSTDGFSWTQHASDTTNNLRSITVGGNPSGIGGTSHLLVTVGDNGTVLTSATALTWTSHSSGTSLTLYGVTSSNGLYVAVGQQGTVVTSQDGVTWAVQNSGTTNNLYAVTYGWAGFLAVGGAGTMLTSSDGVNWTPQNSGTSSPLESASFGNGYYLVTGANATVLTSSDGINWTPRGVGATGNQSFYGSGFLNGRFDIVGVAGNILESDAVPALFTDEILNVSPQIVITTFITPGSTFRIQDITNLLNPAWSTAATFNNAAGITRWTNSTAGTSQSYYRIISP